MTMTILPVPPWEALALRRWHTRRCSHRATTTSQAGILSPAQGILDDGQPAQSGDQRPRTTRQAWLVFQTSRRTE
jgi:hypothetical protein